MTKPAFIVDGFTEKAIVQRLCPNHPIIRTNLNGKDVRINAIAEVIAAQVRLLGNRNYPIIILVDREERSASAKEIAQELRRELVDRGLGNQDLRIGVADRMIENWIIADWSSLKTQQGRPGAVDGGNGAAKLKKLRKSYHKITDGVELFAAADPREIYKHSESFKDFVDQLADLDCAHLRPTKRL